MHVCVCACVSVYIAVLSIYLIFSKINKDGVFLLGSTRISNELGAGNAPAARVSVYTAMILTMIETLLVSGSLFASRRVFGYTFSNEKEVVDYVTNMAPLVCLSVILDSIQGVLSG